MSTGVMTTGSLQAARKVYYDIYKSEGDKLPALESIICSKVASTKQEYEIFRTINPFGPPQQTNDGSAVPMDTFSNGFALTLRPLIMGLGSGISKQAKFTDVYGIFKNMMKPLSFSFHDARNTFIMNLLNLGFSSTAYGVNSEALFSSTHSGGTGGTSYDNLGTSIPFSTAALKDMGEVIRKQVYGRGQKIGYHGGIKLIVPPALEFEAHTAVKSNGLYDTANRADNVWMKNRFEVFVSDYASSDTAYFGIAKDHPTQGLVFLRQMPFEVDQLPMNESLVTPMVASESYNIGWYDARGTYGNQGA